MSEDPWEVITLDEAARMEMSLSDHGNYASKDTGSWK